MARKSDVATMTSNNKAAPSASSLRHLRSQIDKLEEFGVDVAAVADDVVAAIVDETITPAEDEVPPPAEDEVPPPAEDEGPPEVEATSGENNEDAPAESEAAA